MDQGDRNLTEILRRLRALEEQVSRPGPEIGGGPWLWETGEASGATLAPTQTRDRSLTFDLPVAGRLLLLGFVNVSLNVAAPQAVDVILRLDGVQQANGNPRHRADTVAGVDWPGTAINTTALVAAGTHTVVVRVQNGNGSPNLTVTQMKLLVAGPFKVGA